MNLEIERHGYGDHLFKRQIKAYLVINYIIRSGCWLVKEELGRLTSCMFIPNDVFSDCMNWQW